MIQCMRGLWVGVVARAQTCDERERKVDWWQFPLTISKTQIRNLRQRWKERTPPKTKQNYAIRYRLDSGIQRQATPGVNATKLWKCVATLFVICWRTLSTIFQNCCHYATSLQSTLELEFDRCSLWGFEEAWFMLFELFNGTSYRHTYHVQGSLT